MNHPSPIVTSGVSSEGDTTRLRLIEVAIIGLLILLVLMQAHLVFIKNVNWDEFYFLSFVHDYHRGSLSRALQTGHVQLFSWLPFVADDEMSQILAARGVMFLLTLGTCVLIFVISRSFHSRLAALLSVVCFLGFGYVLEHSFSFRTDTLCAFVFMAALYCIRFRDNSKLHLPIAAVLMAVAMLISIKSVFYLGIAITILAILAVYDTDRRAETRRALGFLFVFAGAWVLLFLLHKATLSDLRLSDSYTYVAGAGRATLLTGDLFPRGAYILRSVEQNPVIWAFMIVSLAGVIEHTRSPERREDALWLLALTIPLLSLSFYRNAFPYFYVFLMAPLAVFGGAGAEVLAGRIGSGKRPVFMVLLVVSLVVIAVGAGGVYWRKLPSQVTAQAEIIDTVHRMFPEPVPYIDRNSMIASFPKVGFFMSTWGMQGYHMAKVPVMRDILVSREPKFVIANTPVLQLWDPAGAGRYPDWYRLLDEDLNVLRSHFIPHWGAIYVAGKSFDVGAEAMPLTFEILISGLYTLETQSSVLIDGARYAPGDGVRLAQGTHVMEPAAANSRILLRWGEGVYRPAEQPSADPIYYGF